MISYHTPRSIQQCRGDLRRWPTQGRSKKGRQSPAKRKTEMRALWALCAKPDHIRLGQKIRRFVVGANLVFALLLQPLP